MRPFLISVIVLQCVVLLGGAIGFLLFGETLRVPPPTSPAFTPPAYGAVIGDWVRYRRIDPDDPNSDLGYVTYTVEHARVLKNSGLGVDLIVRMQEVSADGKERTRRVRVQPRLLDHGFLPPTFRELEEEDVPGAKPVVRTIRTADVDGKPGFEIETVRPREGRTEVSERLWVRPDVPVFGVYRWERDDEIWVRLGGDRAKTRQVKEIG
ncbi:MAG: hypothetical protein AAGD14_08660 [Planctomycetota bacterium]